MNFDDTPQEAAFRAEVRAWIDANAPKHLEAELKPSGFGHPALEGDDPMSASKAWQKKKADAGWACLHWPKEYGGRGATPIERVIWSQEEGVYGALSGALHHRPRHVRPDGDGLWPARSRSAASCRRSRAAKRSGASSSPSPRAAPTSRACAPSAEQATATTGSSTARRSGRPARSTPTTAF